MAFVLFGFREGLDGAFNLAMSRQRADVLHVTNRVKGALLPQSYRTQIETIPGVETVIPQNYLHGEYQSPSQMIAVLATDPARYFAIHDYWRVSLKQIQALEQTRTGAIVGAQLARTYGWRVGDRIPMTSQVLQRSGSATWLFDVVGIYEYPEEPERAAALIVNNEYVDGARVDPPPGSVARFVIKVAGAQAADAVIERTDALFANSPYETTTVYESESAQARLQSMHDLRMVVSMVAATAFLALLFSGGTLLMNSLRQRTHEFGILKALGFSDLVVTALLVSEVVLICLVGALLGLALAWALLPLAHSYVGHARLPLSASAEAFALVLVVALVFAWVPARHALRLRISEALARS